MDGKKYDDGSPLWAKDDRIHWGIAIACLVVVAVSLICGNMYL